MTIPNTFIVGAAKSGTTSLAAYLGQHPQAFIAEAKEPNYFALSGMELPPKGPAPAAVLMGVIYNRSFVDRDAYLALYEAAGEADVVIDASVRYLYFEAAAAAIAREASDPKIIAVLRNPVDRLYSHYNMNRQIALEPLSLHDALDAEPARIADGWGWDWHYDAVSRYAGQIERYASVFPADRLHVCVYDDFTRDPSGEYAKICRFLGIDDQFRPDMSARGMVSSRPRSVALARALWWPSAWRRAADGIKPRFTRRAVERLKELNAAPVPRLDARTRERLSAAFLEDAERLEEALGRKLPWFR